MTNEPHRKARSERRERGNGRGRETSDRPTTSSHPPTADLQADSRSSRLRTTGRVRAALPAESTTQAAFVIRRASGRNRAQLQKFVLRGSCERSDHEDGNRSSQHRGATRGTKRRHCEKSDERQQKQQQ